MKMQGYDIEKIETLTVERNNFEFIENEFKKKNINSNHVNILNIMSSIDDIQNEYDPCNKSDDIVFETHFIVFYIVVK